MDGAASTLSGVPSLQGAVSSTYSSPVSAQRGKKRKSDLAGFDASPASADDAGTEDETNDRRRLPGVKRACNECRQQKLRCDVVQEPYTSCSRCRRLGLECKIESNFKRVGKRSKNAEMEREIVELRRQLAEKGHGSSAHTSPTVGGPMTAGQSPLMYQHPTNQDAYLGSHEAVASLLDLKSGLDGSGQYIGNGTRLKRIEDVALTPESVSILFDHFFTFYHPFLPILDPGLSADQYYELSPLLFWTITSIGSRRYPDDTTLLNTLSPPVTRLIWSTLAGVPQSHHVVKALALLCFWPFPISSTSTDPSFMLSGIMMRVAMQIGLHRPSHAQDFSKFRVELHQEELNDRVKTWAIANLTCQSISTGYGQPPSTLYDWTLSHSTKDASYTLPEELEQRIRIEKFSDKVTKALYFNQTDPVGLMQDKERIAMTNLLARDYEDLTAELGLDISPITTLYRLAVGLHLRLSAFFDSPSSPNYLQDLLALYFSTTSFLEHALNLTTPETGLTSMIPYAPYYIFNMITAAGFTLLKLLNSFFAQHIDLEHGRQLFNRTISAMRTMSVATNDLPVRLAEVLAQLWRGSGSAGGSLHHFLDPSSGVDGSLQLKVRCRMSMSLVFDSVWRWREDFQAKGRGNLDSAVRNPTNPDSSATSSTSGGAGLDSVDPSLAPPPTVNGLPGMQGPPSGMLTPSSAAAAGMGFMGDPNYEVFDPLNWMLDGLVDFPYPLNSVGLDPAGQQQGLV